MPLNATELHGRTVAAADGKLGALEDLVFEDSKWAMRFIVVVESPDGLEHSGHVAAASLQGCRLADGVFRLERSRDDIFRAGPEAPSSMAPQDSTSLVSAREIIHFGVEASDGAVGMIDELVVDDRTWSLSHIVADGRRWWPGRRVWISADAIASVDRSRRMIRLSVSRTSLTSRSAASNDAFSGRPLPCSAP